MVKSHDPECRRLAEHFLPWPTNERLISDLAQAIQDAVEDWIEAERDKLKSEAIALPVSSKDAS